MAWSEIGKLKEIRGSIMTSGVQSSKASPVKPPFGFETWSGSSKKGITPLPKFKTDGSVIGRPVASYQLSPSLYPVI